METAAPVSAPAPARKTHKPHRWKPGTVALREIRNQQKSTSTACPKQAIERLIREIAGSFKSDVRFNKQALLALQEGTEQYIVELFKQSQSFAIHAGRQTITVEDLQLAHADTEGAPVQK